MIGGYYFSTSGGYTENSENVWSSALDYLKAVPDIYEPQDLKKSTWSVTLSADEVKSMLASRGINVGDIVDLVPTQFSDVGRVTELKVVGTNGTEYLTKEKARTYLGLDSQWYTINSEPPEVPNFNMDEIKKDDEPEIEEEVTKRNNTTKKRDDIYKTGDTKKEEEVVKETKPLLKLLLSFVNSSVSKDEPVEEKQTAYAAKANKGDFVIQGRGWGHGIGMSQNGAIGMAKNDFSYEEIIKWYYSGVKVEK